MIVEGVTMGDVQDAAELVGIEVYLVKKLPVSKGMEIELEQEPGDSFSTGAGGVCIHGHAEFIATLLERNHEACVRTRAGVYSGWAGFNRDHAHISTQAFKLFGRSQRCNCA